MDSEIERHFNNRFKGFYFWTTKKNFLSLYIFSQINQNIDLLEIFKFVLLKTMITIDTKRRDQCLNDWNNFIYSEEIGNWKQPKYIIEPIEYILPKKCPRFILNFLYTYKYNIEEFFVYIIKNIYEIKTEKLLYDAMIIFTEIHYYTEHFNCPNQYTMSHYCPIKSVNSPKNFNWNDYLTHLKISNTDL
jgi:hypothetical protein